MAAIQIILDGAKSPEYNVMNTKLNIWARFRETIKQNRPSAASRGFFLGGWAGGRGSVWVMEKSILAHLHICFSY